MLMGWATVDLRRGLYLVTSYSAANLAKVANGWVESASVSVTDAELGALVRSAMAESRTGVPFPNFRNSPSPSIPKLLKLAGVSSYSRYVSGVRNLLVACEPDVATLTITPSRNEGARGNFKPLPDARTELPADIGDGELGAAIRAGLELAE
jgi:hypothetical protein